jgi:hypothetical protein
MIKKMMKMMRTLTMLMSDLVVVSLFGVLMPKGEKVPFACVSIWIWFSIWIWLGHKLLYLVCLCPMVELRYLLCVELCAIILCSRPYAYRY